MIKIQKSPKTLLPATAAVCRPHPVALLSLPLLSSTLHRLPLPSKVTLEPFERDHACVVGAYRLPKKQKVEA